MTTPRFAISRSTSTSNPWSSAVQAQAEAVAATQGFITAMWQAVVDAGPALLLGLAVLAVAGAVLGFALTWLLWPRRGQEA